jgi:hypothetical protein
MWRRFIYWALTITFAYLVITRLTEIRHLLQTLAEGVWWWIAIATLIQLGSSLINVCLYQITFDFLKVKSRFVDLVPVFFASYFVNIAAPVGGAGAAALFADNASRHHQSSARAAAGSLLVQMAQFTSFGAVLLVGLFLLKSQGQLYSYEIIAATLLLLLILALSAFIFLGLKHPKRLTKILNWLQKTFNRVVKIFNKKKTRFDENWVQEHVEEFNEAATAIAASPQMILKIITFALIGHIVNLLMLCALFPAFHAPINIATILVSYTVAILFMVVSITPQGVGVVEGVMPLVMTSLGVASAPATLVTLSFRGLSFWLPLAIGAITIRRIKSFQNDT